MQRIISYVREFPIRMTLIISGLIFLVWYAWMLPTNLFQVPYSKVVYASDTTLIGVTLSNDGQWRFPIQSDVPEKFRLALIHAEDQRFESHFGFDFLAMGRAIRQNLRAGKIISGGSTITMQVARMSGGNRSRTVTRKLYEILLASRIELSYSKSEILELYAAHAPMGGNVVGLEAACRRYYGRSATTLSWAEASLLAVLPNAPALIHPGKNRDALVVKRNRLLKTLLSKGIIDSLTWTLGCSEPLPEIPNPFPNIVPHITTYIKQSSNKDQLYTSIEPELQRRLTEVVSWHSRRLEGNKIHNIAAIITKVSTGEVLAYVGNSAASATYSSDVDIIRAPRSTGSILKPVLFAAMLSEGKLLPQTLVEDVPLYISGYHPENFNHAYDGVVPAGQSIVRSLNIPSVMMLRSFRYEKFHHLLGRLGITGLNPNPDQYGLSLILGGAEATLWDLTGAYSSMARVLVNHSIRKGQFRYNESDIHPSRIEKVKADVMPGTAVAGLIKSGSIYETFNTLTAVQRPGEESGWYQFNSSRKIAWKTGTSFGFRDAWAIGVTPEYVVGIWVGNASGEGRPGLVGLEASAPVLFDVYNFLPQTTWFQEPVLERMGITVCSQSGFLPGPVCPIDSIFTYGFPDELPVCMYHEKIFLSQDGKERVTGLCAELNQVKERSWFILPPVAEHYYRRTHAEYKQVPPWRVGCTDLQESMAWIYPLPDTRIFLPRELSGELGSIVAQVAHRNHNSVIYWHLDQQYLGSTRGDHKLPFQANAGSHQLTALDDTGMRLTVNFQVLMGNSGDK